MRLEHLLSGEAFPAGTITINDRSPLPPGITSLIIFSLLHRRLADTEGFRSRTILYGDKFIFVASTEEKSSLTCWFCSLINKREITRDYSKKVNKSEWWMPWLSEAKKDVTSCDKLRGGANIRYIRRFPNGATLPAEGRKLWCNNQGANPGN